MSHSSNSNISLLAVPSETCFTASVRKICGIGSTATAVAAAKEEVETEEATEEEKEVRTEESAEARTS